MLILTRAVGQVLLIGEHIEVQVRETGKDGQGRKVVHLSIIAPGSVPVHRREIWEERQREEALAAKWAGLTLSLPTRGEAEPEGSARGELAENENQAISPANRQEC